MSKTKTQTTQPVDATGEDQKPVPPELTLSTGATVEIQPIFGKHIRQARRMQQEADLDYMFSLISQVVTIDGQGITPMDLDEMPGRDVALLTEQVQGKF